MGVWKNINGVLSDVLQINIEGPKFNKISSSVLNLKDKDGNSATLNVDKITGLSVPVSSTDACNKEYTDAIGLPKKSVRALATTNITLSGTQTVDGVSLIADDECGVIGQTDKEDNGIYVVKADAWVRRTDADGTPDGEVSSGMCFSVREGTTYAGWGVILITPNPITVGTTELEFTDWEPSAASLLKGAFNANTIMKADSDDTPVPLTVAASTIVGRTAAGSIAALTATQVRTIINVEDGADVTDAGNVGTALGSINANALADITSAGANIEDAVTKRHSQNTDTQLDSGSVEVDADDCFKMTETAYFDAEFDNGDSGAADTISWKVGNKQKSTLTANCTYTFTAPSGPCSVILKIIQGGSGSYTVTWPGTVKWSGGVAPTLSTGVGDIDIVSFYYDGTSYFGMANYDFQVPA
jgi:hypothetical protein